MRTQREQIETVIPHYTDIDGASGYFEEGPGNEQHILGAWFAQLAGITLEPVPYRGGGPAINDLLAGHVKKHRLEQPR
jgi:tripartite-type tricarboxylate transporter receptor subunit TctC